jgi:hypothetical protein
MRRKTHSLLRSHIRSLVTFEASVGRWEYLGENHQKLAIPAVYVNGGCKEKAHCLWIEKGAT